MSKNDFFQELFERWKKKHIVDKIGWIVIALIAIIGVVSSVKPDLPPAIFSFFMEEPKDITLYYFKQTPIVNYGELDNSICNNKSCNIFFAQGCGLDYRIMRVYSKPRLLNREIPFSGSPLTCSDCKIVTFTIVNYGRKNDKNIEISIEYENNKFLFNEIGTEILVNKQYNSSYSEGNSLIILNGFMDKGDGENFASVLFPTGSKNDIVNVKCTIEGRNCEIIEINLSSEYFPISIDKIQINGKWMTFPPASNSTYQMITEKNGQFINLTKGRFIFDTENFGTCNIT
ncbi:MAG: hypothetical protein EPN86_02825 [Nanoarchaeota archaeon]|nr:MAG: hypothetical protein EPN86_02825 [Nanoarchaeota archaeon]